MTYWIDDLVGCNTSEMFHELASQVSIELMHMNDVFDSDKIFYEFKQSNPHEFAVNVIVRYVPEMSTTSFVAEVVKKPSEDEFVSIYTPEPHGRNIGIFKIIFTPSDSCMFENEEGDRYSVTGLSRFLLEPLLKSRLQLGK